MKEAIAVVVLLVVVAAAFLALKSRPSSGTGRAGSPKRPSILARAPVAVEVSPVERATIRAARTFIGSLRPRFYFTVAPKIQGRLKELTVNIGDRVKRGELVAVLEDDESAQACEQARAGLAVARATVDETQSALAQAARELARAKELRAKEIASESELDAAKTRYEAEEARRKVAVAQVTQKEAAFKAAEVRLAYTRVRALWPRGGGKGSELRLVGERFVDEGEMLRANEPVVSIIDIDTVIAVVHVVERDYARISLGQQASVAADAFPGRTFTGEVVRIAPLLKETSRQARVEIEVVNSAHELKPGMFVRARIIFEERPRATVIPVAALVRRGGRFSPAEGDRWGVFVVQQDHGSEGAAERSEGEPSLQARFVPVELGIVEGDRAEVLEPALSGVVVTLGQHLLEDGSPVTLAGRRAPEAEVGAGASR